MALSRSLRLPPPYICFHPPAAAATHRPRIHLLQKPIRKQNAGLSRTVVVPWAPSRLHSRRIAGNRAHVAALQANSAQAHVDALPPNEPNGEAAGEPLTPEDEGRRKPPRRSRKGRRKVGDETNSSSVFQKRDVEEALATQVPNGGSPDATLKPISGEAVVESLLESGVVQKDNGEAATALKSSSFPSLKEVPELQVASTVVCWATGGVVTASSTAGEIEQGPEETRKKKKKRTSKKTKETQESLTNSNGTFNAISGVVDTEPVGRVVAGEQSINEGSNRSYNSIHEVANSSEGPIPLETTLTSGAASESYIANKAEESVIEVSTKKKKRAKKNPSLDQEGGQTSTPEERQNNSRRGGDAAVTENLGSKGVSGSSVEEEQSVPQGNNTQGSSKPRKRGGRKKAVSTIEPLAANSDEHENAAEDTKGRRGGVELRSQSSRGISRASDKLHTDGRHKVAMLVPLLNSIGLGTFSKSSSGTDDDFTSAEGDGGQQFNDTHKNLLRTDEEGNPNSFQTGDNNIEGSKSKGGPVSKEEGDIRDDSSDHLKPARRSRRRKQSKKRVPDSRQVESQSEQIVSGGDDVFDSIIWCTVHLKVRAVLELNEHLYVVGANPELGGWDLSLALPLPKLQEEEFCGNTLKIPRGTMLEYKYFAEARDADSSVIDRWFGSEIQYFLPWKEGQGSEIEVIRDTWIPDIPTSLPMLSWGERWWEEMDSVENDEDAFGDKGKEFDHLMDFREAVNAEDQPLDTAEGRVEISTEQPALEEWLKKKIRRKVFPREEPWLLESMIMEQRNGSVRRKMDDAETSGEGMEGTEAFEADQKDPTVQVEILINSPQCTMQRMAILEDGKLVELLLEPVNTRVQVGNVYLGVVRQLLPGMTGVFVDIGGFQLALLDITRNQYPYTFPSIGQYTGVSGDGQSWNSLGDEEESDWEGEIDDDEEEEDEHDGDFDEDEEGEDGEVDEEEEVEEDAPRGRSIHAKVRVLEGSRPEHQEGNEAIDTHVESVGKNVLPLARTDSSSPGPITVNFGRKLKKWRKLQEGMQIIVQVKKEAFGKKGPRLTAFPSLAGRFWVLIPGGKSVGVSRRITGPERKRLRQLAQDLLPTNFALTVRTEALGHDREDLEKDLARLLETWKEVLECASAASVAVEHGMDGAVPVLLHRAMGQTLTIVRDFFNDKVYRMVIDSPQCYQEVTSYLQEVAPQLSDRVELYTDKMPIFDAFDIESEIEKFSSKRVSLPNGGYLVMEETEALVSIDVNGGMGVLAHDISQEEAILGVNLAAARQIATELRLRDIGGIIVVDFIDMEDSKSEKLVLDEMRRAISRDRSTLSLSEISDFGLMEMTRKRVRPSVTLTISDPCSHCGGVGRVEAHETTLSKIERAVRRLLATRSGQTNTLDSSKWPQLILRVDTVMGEYLKGRKRKRMTQLSAALKVWLNLKVALDFSLGHFQVREQHRTGSDKRTNGTGPLKSNQQNIGPSLLGKKGLWPGKRRRNFASNKVS